jgi:ribosomal protein S18 acetylase RimI-like enzyme
MQRLAAEQRRLLGRRAEWHVGDIAWGMQIRPGDVRLWEEGADLVAWAWKKADRAILEFDVRRDRLDLLDEILDDPEARTTFVFEDDEEQREALARHGYVEPGRELRYFARRLDERPEPPEGFAYRTVTADDLAERAAIHRDVWAPSRVTDEVYAAVRESWPYRETLDCVVEAPDGGFAAYALAWPDDENGVGELEPVGVRSAYRRQGLGAAVCTFALARMYDEGLREAIVYCDTDGLALYASIGFEQHARLVGYSR